MPEHIIVSEVKNHVCTITLNRPQKKNALSIALRDELTEALSDLEVNEDLKVVIVTGEGDLFSAGFDLKEFQQAAGDKEFEEKLWASSDAYHQKCLTFPLPTIAALNGPAIAGGLDLATMCDLRVACPETYFLHPEIAFGEVMYGPLHDLVGGALARELCFTGRRVDAGEALAIHLVSGIVRREQLLKEARRYAQMIAQAPREVCKATKSKIVNRAGFMGLKTLAL